VKFRGYFKTAGSSGGSCEVIPKRNDVQEFRKFPKKKKKSQQSLTLMELSSLPLN
jgi:hypothetical protein